MSSRVNLPTQLPTLSTLAAPLRLNTSLFSVAKVSKSLHWFLRKNDCLSSLIELQFVQKQATVTTIRNVTRACFVIRTMSRNPSLDALAPRHMDMTIVQMSMTLLMLYFFPRAGGKMIGTIQQLLKLILLRVQTRFVHRFHQTTSEVPALIT